MVKSFVHELFSAYLHVFANTDRTGCRKIGWNLLGYFARGRPFGAALKRRTESDAIQGHDIMPQRRMEDAPFAIAERHQQRLIVARALIVRV